MGRFRGAGAPGRLELEVGKGGWRGDDFTRVGRLEDKAHLRMAIVQGLEVEAGISSLPTEIGHLGEKVLGEEVGCAGAILCIGAVTAGAVAIAPVPWAGPSR